MLQDIIHSYSGGGCTEADSAIHRLNPHSVDKSYHVYRQMRSE